MGGERYETARIDVELFEEDVIAASVVRCEKIPAYEAHPEYGAVNIDTWIIYYSDGTSEWDTYGLEPSVCP